MTRFEMLPIVICARLRDNLLFDDEDIFGVDGNAGNILNVRYEYVLSSILVKNIIQYHMHGA